ncbi:MAG: ABC transporter permease [Clostridia bacterium]|nr:ABC transporter permease [Clostridia bacterium]
MHIIGEVITNLNKNRVLTITSIFTVFIMLMLVGVFGIFLLNISYNSEYMDNMLEIRIFIDPNADEYRENRVREALLSDNRIDYLAFQSKEQAFEDAKEIYDKEVIEGLGPDFLPASYTVRLREEVDADKFVAFAEGIPDVYQVDYHAGSFEFAVSLANWVNLVSGILAMLLGVLSLFLISNTIRLTMASRSAEVIIMKFIGATESRIKLPFLIEGITIGFLGAAISSVVVGLVYNRIHDWFYSLGVDEVFLSGLSLVPVRETVLLVIIVFFGLGIMLGMFGSMMAIRKNLKV